MRRLWVLLLGVGLVGAAQGCSKTLRCTQGVCDCYPPPVETLLVPYCAPPTPPSPSLGVIPNSPAPPLAGAPMGVMPNPAGKGVEVLPNAPKGVESIPTPPSPAPMPQAK